MPIRSNALIVGNKNINAGCSAFIIVDSMLGDLGDHFRMPFSDKINAQMSGSVIQLATGAVQVQEADEPTATGPLKYFQLTLAPLEVQLIGK